MASLRGQYAQTARELASLGETLLPQHPRILEVKAELAETQRLLKAELVRIRASVATAYAQAVDNLGKLQVRARELTRDKVASSEAEITLRQLESEADAIRSVFNASLSRARELDQQGKIATSNSHVLSEAAVPLKPSKPPLPIVAAAAALFGACVGLGIAFLLDIAPRRVRSRPSAARATDDLAVATGAPTRPATRPWSSGGPGPTPLGKVASDLQQRFGASLPAVVAVVGVPDSAPAGAIAEALARALAEAGEEVLHCAAGPADAMRVRRFEPRAPHADAAGFVAAARGLAGTAVTARPPPRSRPAASSSSSRPTRSGRRPAWPRWCSRWMPPAPIPSGSPRRPIASIPRGVSSRPWWRSTSSTPHPREASRQRLDGACARARHSGGSCSRPSPSTRRSVSSTRRRCTSPIRP